MHHSENLRSGDIYQVAEVVRNRTLRNRDHHLSNAEKQMLINARQVLVSELP
jgi:CarD family transcriptional regulator